MALDEAYSTSFTQNFNIKFLGHARSWAGSSERTFSTTTTKPCARMATGRRGRESGGNQLNKQMAFFKFRIRFLSYHQRMVGGMASTAFCILGACMRALSNIARGVMGGDYYNFNIYR